MGQKNKKNTGLGRSLIKDRFKHNPNQYYNEDGLIKNNFQSDTPHTNMQSITQENDLEQFLHTAELMDRDFTATRLNVTIVSNEATPVDNSALHEKFRDLLTIPKRPEWDSTTTKQQLIESEKREFLNWRRSLVFLEEDQNLLLTPYERNIEIWRQLWRVVEKSELVVQIVDARDPLFFQSIDLQKYAESNQCVHLLLVNKADLLSRKQRISWSKYFTENKIEFLFFSAHMAKEILDEEQLAVDEFGQQRMTPAIETVGKTTEDVPDEARILNARELLDTLKEKCPESDYSRQNGKRTIGFVGYPNVGKSSTLNALIGSTKVAVASTPGKTKHFQTIHLDDIVLCDCPGLVFPSFATTKAEMVVNGVLPIDQLRDHVPPVELVAKRIPKWYLESVYGIKIITKNSEGMMIDRQSTAEELLQTYASTLV
jgi:large subunit GTPase 1